MSDITQTLEASVDAAIYAAMQKAQPNLVEAIRETMALGESPAQIERRMRRTFGNTQVLRDVRHIAEHIRRYGLTHARVSTLPQQFEQIVRRDNGFILERCDNGNYCLWRQEDCWGRDYYHGPRYVVVGDARHYQTRLHARGFWAAGINQPYDAETDSASREIYAGDSEEAAVTALWEARHDAW